MPSTPLLSHLRAALREVADPARAPAMQAYMKSTMPFHGVPTPVLNRVSKQVFADLHWNNAASWQAQVLQIWRHARFREERYAALNLAADKRARAFQLIDAMPLYEELVVSGAWWDYVDRIAAHQIGPILARDPLPMRHQMLEWSRSENIWKRRSAILCQLNFKADTDLDLLYQCIEPSLASNEFFLRKAIGWALRQYARTDADEVRGYVSRNQARLSSLSVREALKHL